MNDKVMVTSMVSGIISLNQPQHRLVKTWPKKGTKLPVDKDALREAIYEPGVEAIFREGILYIDDMDFKIELGLEEESLVQVMHFWMKYINYLFQEGLEN